jgi:hypothetical protein
VHAAQSVHAASWPVLCTRKYLEVVMRIPKKTKKLPMDRHAVLDDGEAFVPDTVRGGGSLDDESEAAAEEFVAQATSAEDVGEDARDEMIAEELGGPFLELQIIGPEKAEYFAPEEEDEELGERRAPR